MNKIIKGLFGVVMGVSVGVYSSSQDDAVTRSTFPYLKVRSQAEFSDGASDRVRSLVWHPTEQMFVAVGGPRSAISEVILYNVFGSSTGAYIRESLLGRLTFGGGYQVNSVAWSEDGSYLAFGGTGVSTNQLNIYSYLSSNQSLTAVFSLTWGGSSSSINSVAWHPSGNYLAIGGNNQTSGYEIIIYNMDFITPLMTPVASVNLGSSAIVNALDWDSDGTYLAVGCRSESTGKAALQTYKFITNGTGSAVYSLTQKSTADFGGSAAYVRALAWSPDNQFIVAGGYSGGTTDDKEIKLYSVSSGVLTNISAGNIDFGKTQYGAYVTTLAWDPQQQYLVAGGYLGNTGETILRQFNMYVFNGSSLTPKIGSQHTFGTNTSSYVSAVAWQPARTFVVVGGYLPYNTYELWLMQYMTTLPKA